MSPEFPNSAQNQPQKFVWTKARERAALLLADDKLTDQQIADDIGVSRRCITKWKAHPEFEARRKKYVEDDRKRAEARRKRIMESGFALIENRVELTNRLIEAQVQIIDERAARVEMQDPKKIPGGRTGLITLQFRGMVDGKPIIEQFADTGLVASAHRSMREMEALVKPLGQQRGADRIDELIDAIRQPVQAQGGTLIAPEDLVRPEA